MFTAQGAQMPFRKSGAKVMLFFDICKFSVKIVLFRKNYPLPRDLVAALSNLLRSFGAAGSSFITFLVL